MIGIAIFLILRHLAIQYDCALLLLEYGESYCANDLLSFPYFLYLFRPPVRQKGRFVPHAYTREVPLKIVKLFLARFWPPVNHAGFLEARPALVSA